MEAFAMLAALAALVFAWWWINRATKRRKWKGAARHLVGAVAGFVAFTVVGALLMPAPGDTKESPPAVSESKTEDDSATGPETAAAPAQPARPFKLLTPEDIDGPWPFVVDEVQLQCFDSGALLVEDINGADLPTYSLTTRHLAYAGPWELSPLADLLVPGAAETEAFTQVVEQTRELCDAHPSPLGDEFLKISDLGENWPFTIDAARILCAEHNSLFLTAARQPGSSKMYPLNGAARSRADRLGADPLEEIWAENPEAPGTRLSVSGAIRIGLDRCKARDIEVVDEEDRDQERRYSGGTLHEAGALEWQRASDDNKFGTLAVVVGSNHPV